MTDRGLTYCLRLDTGEVVYEPERLPSGTYSSSPPILADGNIYVSTEEKGLWTVYPEGLWYGCGLSFRTRWAVMSG